MIIKWISKWYLLPDTNTKKILFFLSHQDERIEYLVKDSSPVDDAFWVIWRCWLDRDNSLTRVYRRDELCPHFMKLDEEDTR